MPSPFQWLLLLLPSLANAAEAISPTADGRSLAQQYCTTCHLFPEPETLSKGEWTNHIQPNMARWLGLRKPNFDAMPGGELLRQAAVFPPTALINERDWSAIWSYYSAAAPAALKPHSRTPLAVGLKLFRARKVNPAAGAPHISLVKIDPVRRELHAGDAFAGMFYTMNPAGAVLRRTRLGSPPVDLTLREGRGYLTLVGSLFPSDAPDGRIVSLRARADAPQTRSVLTNLHRPVQTIPADLNQDGREDLLVVAFGHHLGRFSWWENKGDGRFTERVLIERPGAVHAEVLDANADGRPDIFVMMAQAREGIYLLTNEGAGRFSLQPIAELPPTWGFAGFDLADFNRDGKIDILAVNGDNGDFDLGPKPYHGLRIYLNDGMNRFSEAFSLPLHGAYRALARDFDGDGDIDVAAVAFYPDFTAAAPENFVYLENKGGLKFAARTLAESADGRWITLDAGDLDGDGDIDLALGSFVRGPTTQAIPASLEARWRTNGAAILLLENLRRRIE